MKHLPPNGAEIDLWLVYSSDPTGTYIEGAFTHKVQAEAFMRWCTENSAINTRHWLRELTTQPHGDGQ